MMQNRRKKAMENVVSRVRPDGPSEPQSPAEVTELVINIIAIIAFIAWLFFGFLTLKNFPYGAVIKAITPVVIIEAAFFLYLGSWIYGTKFDTKTFKKAFPREITIATPVSAYCFLFGTAILFAAVVYVALSSKYQFTYLTPLALLVFWIYNIIANWYMHLSVINKAFSDSCNHCRNNNYHIGCLRLHEGIKYHKGAWQKARFIVGLILSGALLFIVASGDYIRIANAVPYLGPEMLIACLFLLFVVTVEGWINLQRIRYNVSIKLLIYLDKNYRILPEYDYDKCQILAKPDNIFDNFMLDKKEVNDVHDI